MNLKLFHYWRSSASWRVRWGLEIKKIPYTPIHLDLLAGETENENHLKRNPIGYVPTLLIDDKIHLSESVAILEWLEEVVPKPSFFPSGSPILKAQVRQLVEIINAGTQPLQNLTPIEKLGLEGETRDEWIRFWNLRGLKAFEDLLGTLPRQQGLYCLGKDLTLADLVLIPQCYNAVRFKVNLEQFPLIQKIYTHCRSLPTCLASEPEKFEPKS